MLAWMAWTWETAAFFGFVALALVILTLLAIYRPETPRKGILRFPTTRGDRFFVTLLGYARPADGSARYTIGREEHVASLAQPEHLPPSVPRRRARRGAKSRAPGCATRRTT